MWHLLCFVPNKHVFFHLKNKIFRPGHLCSSTEPHYNAHTFFLFLCYVVQVAGGGGSSDHGQVEIFSLNRATPRLVKTVPLRTPILCLEYVKEPCPSTEEKEAERTQTAAKIGNIICVGLQDGRSVSFLSFCRHKLTQFLSGPVSQ